MPPGSESSYLGRKLARNWPVTEVHANTLDMTSSSSLRGALLVPAFIALLAGCSADRITGTSPSSIAGTYTALVMRVTPSGQSTIDVLARGGGLTLAIAGDNSTTGTLSIPAIAGGPASTASMVGTVVKNGNHVRFQQSADSFVRDLDWTVNGQQLLVTDQTAGTASYTITLVRL